MIEIGNVIKLRPSAFAEEFHSYGDATHGYPWSEKYLYEDRFKAISLRFKLLNQSGDMAKTFFGSSETIVEEIEYDYNGQPFIILTTNLRIIYPKALENNELSHYPLVESDFRPIQSEKQLIDDLESFELDYLKGIFNVMERENNKSDFYKYGLYAMLREGKWKNIIQ